MPFMDSCAARTAAGMLGMLLLLAGCSAGTPDAGPDNRATQQVSDRSSPSGSTPNATASPSGSTSLSASPSPSASASPSESEEAADPEPTSADAKITRLPRKQWRRMVSVGMWRPGCPVRRDQLRRIQVNYVGFDGSVRRGELVANRDVARSLARIFTRLFEKRFPIRRMQSLENFAGDSDASLRADNTALYNCRRPDQINAPQMESPHANGRAIDINPRENPWKDLRCDCWSPAAKHHRRTPGKGKILEGGLVWRLFKQEGWIWQNIDVPDYMHFDTGYPSRPWTSPKDQ